MRRLKNTCAMVVAAGLCSTPALAVVDEIVREATAEVQAGQAQAAYARLAPLLVQRANDPDYNYVLGLAAADSGRPAEAIVAFQRVLDAQPDNAQARAELARAYALGGDIDTAREQFDTVVQDPSLPDPVRQRFDAIVRDYDQQIEGGDSDISGFIDVSGGYDSNINAATDLTQITIPLFAGFGPGALGPGATRIEDAFYEIVAGISGVTAISRQSRLFGSVLGNWRDNFDSDAFDQAALTGTAGFAHTMPSRDVISISGQLQQFWLGRDAYRLAYGSILQYTHRLEGGRALSFSGEYFRLDYDTDPLRDADRFGAGVSYATRNFVASVTGGHEETRNAAGDHLSYNYGRLNFSAEYPLAMRTSVVGGVTGQFRRYDASDPLFLVEREDEQADLSLGLKFLITENVYARPRASFTKNWSNIALYEYERFTGSIGIRAEF